MGSLLGVDAFEEGLVLGVPDRGICKMAGGLVGKSIPRSFDNLPTSYLASSKRWRGDIQ